MRGVTVICALAAMTPYAAVGDETFRCGKWIVSIPLSVPELVEKCGEPSSRTASTQDVRAKIANGGTEKLGTTTTEIWRYNRGTRAAPMIVTIVDGTIQSLERGE